MKIEYKQAAIIGITFLLGMFVGGMVYKNMQPHPKDPNAKINEIIRLIKENYVDNKNIDSIAAAINSNKTKMNDSLELATINTILKELDPHSVYLPPVQLKSANEEMKGAFAGVGIEYMNYNDTIYVAHVVKDGPAQKANIELGDKIIKVNDSTVSGIKITNTRLRALLRGEMDSKVQLKIIKQNGQEKITTVTRGTISLPAIDASYMLTNTIGFIKLNKFSINCAADLHDAIAKLQKEGMQSLIFDLRDNPGGSLADAVAIVDEFVGGKELVTYTSGAHKTKDSYYTRVDGLFEKGKLIVLVDEGSASASEVVTGALQDLDRATIVGRRSFGKGLVQQQFSLPDNSALRLTIARYYTSSGRSIQKDYSKGREAYADDINERIKNNSLFYADSNVQNKAKVYTTKAGKKVYGGGGVMPDVFVALDTIAGSSAMYGKVQEKSLFLNFSTLFYIRNKGMVTSYKTATEFATNYKLSDAEWNNFIQFCKKENIDLSSISTTQKEKMKEHLVQLITRVHWRMEGYIEALNIKDKAIDKAKTLLTN